MKSSRYVMHNEDIFDLLQIDVLKHKSISKVIINGDTNARCGILLDYIDCDYSERVNVDCI